MKKIQTESYGKLLKKVQKVISVGRRQVEAVKLRTYWQTGKLISQHVRGRGGKVGYGHNVVHRLAADLDTNKTHLYHSLEFYAAYPIFPTWGKLGWSHYKYLLSVNDSTKRKQLTQKACVKHWSVRELRIAISKIKGTQKKKTKTRKLVARMGKVGAFRVVPWPLGGSKGAWAYDLGFANYKKLRKKPRKQPWAKDLYTYLCRLERVVDADTLWVNVQLTRTIATRQKIRLRGIDAPETRTRAGKRAKAFLEDYLKETRELVIRTSKSDKYDRYLADVYVGQTYLNQFLADQGFAVTL